MNSVGAQRSGALAQRRPQDPEQPDKPEHGRGGREGEGDDVGDPAAGGDRHQCVLPICLLIRSSSSLAIVSTMKVTTNSRKPSAISDER